MKGNFPEIKSVKLKSNGVFSITKPTHDRAQHPNQQGGLDKYIEVLDHDTGNINAVKLYETKHGVCFKKKGTWYLNGFTQDSVYVPFQIMVIKK
jgi:hypothetical protein